MAIGAASSTTWSNMIALKHGCVLQEVKAGSFDPNQPKDPAPWAPVEGCDAARVYLRRLLERISE